MTKFKIVFNDESSDEIASYSLREAIYWGLFKAVRYSKKLAEVHCETLKICLKEEEILLFMNPEDDIEGI